MSASFNCFRIKSADRSEDILRGVSGDMHIIPGFRRAMH